MVLNRNLWILFSCQLIAVSSTTVTVTLGGIIGSELSTTPALATLPVSLMIVGIALTAIPAAMLMKAIGRRRGFTLAALLGAAGAALGTLALIESSFALFCAATLLLGVNLGFVQQYRFAAAESVPAQRVGRAISLVLLGSIGGAIVGPAIATHGQDWIAAGRYAGCTAAVTALLLASAGLLLFLRDVQPHDSGPQQLLPPRSLRQVISQPLYIVALMGGLVGYSVMNFIMTATPVSMHVIDGHSVEHTAGVIRSHVIAMYAPSLVSGFLIERLGTRRMMAIGAVIMLATVVVGLRGHQVLHYWLALVLLGVGWNFLYIGGTTLLTRTYRTNERFKSQAINDFSIFTMSATGSLMAGTVIHYLGWTTLLLLVTAPLFLMLLALLWVRNQRVAVPVS